MCVKIYLHSMLSFRSSINDKVEEQDMIFYDKNGMFLFDLTSLLHSDCVIQFVKLCYYSCKSFDEIVPDLFIPPNGLRKLCLNSVN